MLTEKEVLLLNNRLKESLDYFRHRTDLYESPEMELAISNKGFNVYGIYCLLCEKSSRNINKPLILDDDMMHLLARKVGMLVAEFKENVEELIKRNLFDQKSYYETRAITNGIIEEGKEITKNKRASKRGDSKKEFHFDKIERQSSKTFNNSKSNINSNSKNDSNSNSNSEINIYSYSNIDSETGNPINITDNENNEDSSLFVNGVLIADSNDLYRIVEELMEANMNAGIKNSIDSYIEENVMALARALENCQNSKTQAISFNYIKKAYSQEKLKLCSKSLILSNDVESESVEDEVEELERLKEERRKRKLLHDENNDENNSD